MIRSLLAAVAVALLVPNVLVGQMAPTPPGRTDDAMISDGSPNRVPASTTADPVRARALGGVNIYPTDGRINGASMAMSDRAWNAVSDRDAKTNFEPVDVQAVLDHVAVMPVTTWNYKSIEGIRHMGVMAQDFYAAFGLGLDDKHISTIDADGVAFAAIQGLCRRLDAQRAEIESLRAEMEQLRSVRTDIDALRAELARLASRPAATDANASIDRGSIRSDGTP